MRYVSPVGRRLAYKSFRRRLAYFTSNSHTWGVFFWLENLLKRALIPPPKKNPANTLTYVLNFPVEYDSL
jgi:hypothetical protein